MTEREESKPMEPKPEQVKFEAEVLVMDFVGDPIRQQLILNKIRENLKRAKDLETFKSWIARDISEAENEVVQKLTKWRNLHAQMDFLDRVIAGEIPFSETSEGVDVK